MNVLVLNGGSSSLKGLLTRLPDGPVPDDPPEPAWAARVDWGRRPGCADVRVTNSRGATDERQIEVESPAAVLEPVLRTLWSGPAKAVGGPGDIHVVGHRVVHGGRELRETTRITPEVRKTIARLAEFAPEHNRLELEAIEAAGAVLGEQTPQVAVFDTAFHRTLPREAAVYPGPFGWLQEGIRRYGFHGISHQYVSRRAARFLGRDPAALHLVTCHLGNGCSLAAVREGKSVDTTMGFTPLEGLMMGTRSGTLDPGILIYLVRQCGYRAEDLDRILNKESGLKGLSGVSGDMREIEDARARGNDRAALAFDVFIHRLARETGAMLASLDRLDALVFTGGIGENSAEVRRAATARLRFPGVRLDSRKNAAAHPDADVAEPGSSTRVLVIHTNEDWEITRECARLMKPGA